MFRQGKMFDWMYLSLISEICLAATYAFVWLNLVDLTPQLKFFCKNETKNPS